MVAAEPPAAVWIQDEIRVIDRLVQVLYLNRRIATDQNDQKDANQSIGSTEPLIQSND